MTAIIVLKGGFQNSPPHPAVCNFHLFNETRGQTADF